MSLRPDTRNSKLSTKDDVAALLQLVNESDVVAEVGAGTGRATVSLAKRCRHVHAIEPSHVAAGDLETATNGMGNVSMHIQPFGATRTGQLKGTSAVVLASLSVNLFLDTQIDEFLEWADQVLPVGGCMILGHFVDDAVSAFEVYDGKIGTSFFLEPFKSRIGEEQMMHTYLVFNREKRILVQNWLLDRGSASEGPRYCIAAQAEKIWSRQLLDEYFGSWGNVAERSVKFQISGGEADGQSAMMTRYRKG